MSKQVDDREKAAAVVVASIEEHGPAIAQKAAIIFRGVDDAEDEAVDEAAIAALLQRIGKVIRKKNQALVAANEAHQAELNDDALPRAARDAATTDLRSTISRFRATVSAAYGDAGLRALGLLDPPLPGPDATRAYTRRAVKELARTDIVLTPLDETGAAVSFNAAAAAKLLEPQLAKLEAALPQVATEVKEAETTRIALHGAFAANDDAFLRGARLFEQFARFVGADEVAALVRPSGRDPGTLAEDEPVDEEQARDAGPAADGPAADAPPRVPIPPGMPGAEPFDDEP